MGGDIILSVDGIPVVSEDSIEQIRNKCWPARRRAARCKMSVLRAGRVVAS